MADDESESGPGSVGSHEDVVQLAKRIGTYCDEASLFASECGRQPAEGSVMARETLDASARISYIYGVWYLYSGIDHLWALMYTMLPYQTPYGGCFTLARACVEASARASWLFEEGLSPKQRIARGMLEQVNNAKSNVAVLPDPAWLKGRLSTIRADASRNKIREYTNNGRQWFDNECRPSATELIDTQLRECYGQTTSQQWIFALLSGYAHSTLSAFRLGVDRVSEGPMGYDRAPLRRHYNWIYAFARIAVTLHMSAVGRLSRLAGQSQMPGIVFGGSNRDV